MIISPDPEKVKKMTPAQVQDSAAAFAGQVRQDDYVSAWLNLARIGENLHSTDTISARHNVKAFFGGVKYHFGKKWSVLRQ